MYFRDCNGPAAHTDRVKPDQGLPAGMEPYPSGFTVATVQRGEAGWTQDDLAAFQAVLYLPRIQSAFAEMLEYVQKRKREIVEHGTDTTRVVADLWIAGLHPLQPGNEPDL